MSTPMDVMWPHIASLLHDRANGKTPNGVAEQRIVIDL